MVESIRFSGLASGMDTQSIVDSLMKVERLPLDKLYRQQQTLEWKRDEYRSMNLLLSELDTFIFDGIYRRANLAKKSVISSNTEFVTATATADAANISYKIENVKLATAARRQSQNSISKDGEKIDPNKSLWSQAGKFNDDSFEWKSETIKTSITVPEDGGREFRLSAFAVEDGDEIKINGETYTIRTDSAEELGENEVFIDTTTGKMVLGSGIELEAGKTYEIEYESQYLEFGIKTYNANGEAHIEQFKIDGSTSLNNLISRINRSQAGINLFYDEGSDKVVATRTETGKFNPDENGNEIEFVKFDEDGNVVENESHSFFTNVLALNKEEGGTNATFTINGLETSRRSNTFTINGVTFTLKKNSVYEEGGEVKNTGEAATINVQTDVDSIVQTIKDFVDKYNEVIDKINGKLSEERYRSYQPLTNEEKEALSKEEIEKWEEKAKSGLLRRDSLLSGALDRMRSILYGEVISNDVTMTNPKYNQLAELGITTTNRYSDRGKLEINEDKLRAAIEEDPEAVYQFFMADGDTYEEKGIARRLRETIQDTIKRIEERAGNSYKTEYTYTMGKELIDIRDRIASFESRLSQAEQRYWQQFTAMEKAIQELNNQSNMLYSYLGLATQG